ncbi:MAG: SRPBCC domain-containing protein [Planctomycetes bacterium]|nr:SRPBCC domain-containing protein [Planctomycetota bacterium]
MKLTKYTIERKYPVSADRLWAGFTDPDLLKQWIWGPGARDVQVERQLHLNGTFNISMDAGDTRWGMRGMYLVIEPGRKLIHTLHWDADVGYNGEGMNPLDEVIVVNIAPDGNGSSIEYIHMGIPDDGQSAPEHERSVRVTLDLLEKVITS